MQQDRMTSEARIANQERLKEEVSTGLHLLMQSQEINAAELADCLGKNRSYISRALSGCQNLTLDSISDLYYALGRSVHIVLAQDFETVRVPVDEVTAGQSKTAGQKLISISRGMPFAFFEKTTLRSASIQAGSWHQQPKQLEAA